MFPWRNKWTNILDGLRMTTCSDHLRSFFCLRRLSIHMVVRQGKWEALLLGRLRTRCAEMCLWHWPQLHRSQILLQLWCRSETMVRSYSLLFLLKESTRAYTLDGFCRRQERKASCTQSIVIWDALIIQAVLELHTTILCFCSICAVLFNTIQKFRFLAA